MKKWIGVALKQIEAIVNFFCELDLNFVAIRFVIITYFVVLLITLFLTRKSCTSRAM